MDSPSPGASNTLNNAWEPLAFPVVKVSATSSCWNALVQAVVSLVAKFVLKSVLTVEDLPTPETPIIPIVGGRASTSRRIAAFTISSSFESAAVWPFADIAPTSLTGDLLFGVDRR